MELTQVIPVASGTRSRAKILPAGSQFGSLTVVRFVGKDINSMGVHVCVCDCGREVFARTSQLTRGKQHSCGRGQCHTAWRGGIVNAGTLAWARNRLQKLAHSSRVNGHAEPVGGVDRVVQLWQACGGVCACCRIKCDTTLCLDHCHVTGRIRGFICRACNIGIGHAKENPCRLFCMAAWVGSQPA